MAQKVIHLKLSTGEEIIGIDISEYRSKDLYLEKVRTLSIQQIGRGEVGIGMIPFMVGNPDGKIRILEAHIVGEPQEETPKNLEDAYLQQVSGISFATQGQPASGIIQT